MSIRWHHIRALAAACRAAATTAGLHPSAPFDVETLAARVFSLALREDAALDDGLYAELSPQARALRLRPGLSANRRRFVIAHELGHLALEGGALALFADDETTIDESAGDAPDTEVGALGFSNASQRAEREANLFALELLVPAGELRALLAVPGWTLEALAQRFAVSQEALRAQVVHVACEEPPESAPPVAPPTFAPDAFQQAAVDAPLPALVVAGPGTGKTRTIVAKYLALIEQGVDPATILALTFSNKAAEEMRERIVAAVEPRSKALAARVEVSTFHAWGLGFLRRHGAALGLPEETRLRSADDIFVLLRQHLAELPLEMYKDVREPGRFLRQIIGTISRAKDAQIGPDAFATLADAEATRLVAAAEFAQQGKTTKTAQQARERASRDAARLRELAAVYASYEALLQQHGALDYGDLIGRAVALLQQPQVAEAAHRQHQYILVDEFQDINDASGELVRLLDGGRGRVWAVGDPWQSIYRFRGASPANIARFSQTYPGASICKLQLNYRSLQPILDASHAIMVSDSMFGQRAGLLARRGRAAGRVTEWVCADPAAEADAIASDICRRSGFGPRVVPLWLAAKRTRMRTLAALTRRLGRAAMPTVRRSLADHAVLCRTNAQANQIAAALRGRGIPVDLAGDLFENPAIKDTLALIGLGLGESPAALRAVTAPATALPAESLAVLVWAAAEREQSLAETVRAADIQALLPDEQAGALAALLADADTLANETNAWHGLVRCCLENNQPLVAAALAGDRAARHQLAAYGELLVQARRFVRAAAEGAQGVAPFLAYLRELREGGERISIGLPPGGEPMVRVMTVHAAKGLEFPVVYLPGLREGAFPPRRQPSSIPPLPALLADPGSDDGAEERYLLYVGMTRARDTLILSRPASVGSKPAERSSLLPADAPWPQVRRRGRSLPEGDQGERLHAPALPVGTPSASMLETYEHCPRQFLYRYGFGLGSEAVGAYGRLHRAIAGLSSGLLEAGAAGTLPSAEALPLLVETALAEHQLEHIPYASDYHTLLLDRATQLWKRLGGATRAMAFGRRYTVQFPHGSVSVPIDETEPGEASQRFVRNRVGSPGENDHLSTRIMLYHLALQQVGGGEVALRYSGGETRPATATQATLDRHTLRIDGLLAALGEGRWQPHFGAHCTSCPFSLICPV